MGSSQTDTNSIPNKNVAGNLRSIGNPQGAGDAYEYGSMTGLSRTVRYKAFANPFRTAPVVMLGPQGQAGGTIIPRIQGTPNTGSFRASLLTIPAGGSFNLYYVAFGQR